MTAVVVVGFTACLLAILYLMEEVGNLKEQNQVWKDAYGKALMTFKEKCDKTIEQMSGDLIEVTEQLNEIANIPSVQLGVQAEKDKQEMLKRNEEDYIPKFFKNR